jgi:hypothetical protein
MAIVLFASCFNNGKRRMPRMNPPYRYADKEPMGTNIAYRLLPGEFTSDITLASKKINNSRNPLAYVKGTAYIIIGKEMSLDDDELGQLLSYVHRGNEFFISGTDIDYRLLDTLGIKPGYDTALADALVHKKNTSLQIADTTAYGNEQHGFFYYPFSSVFTAYNNENTKILGVNENKHPNYIAVKYGKGKFYFHSAPAAFSNYFLLTADNTEYYSQVFSYLNRDANTVYWGDIYKFGKKTDFSALSIFWKNPLLKYALLVACTLMLLYIAFGSKRKRRLIPELPPNTNASLSFVQTIGNLYLQKKDNRNIGIKKMTYFLEWVRNNYHINTNNINAEFVQALSRKSGVAEQRVQSLMEKAGYINNSDTITDRDLFEVNNLIDEFYKR